MRTTHPSPISAERESVNSMEKSSLNFENNQEPNLDNYHKDRFLPLLEHVPKNPLDCTNNAAVAAGTRKIPLSTRQILLPSKILGFNVLRLRYSLILLGRRKKLKPLPLSIRGEQT